MTLSQRVIFWAYKKVLKLYLHEVYTPILHAQIERMTEDEYEIYCYEQLEQQPTLH